MHLFLNHKKAITCAYLMYQQLLFGKTISNIRLSKRLFSFNLKNQTLKCVKYPLHAHTPLHVEAIDLATIKLIPC